MTSTGHCHCRAITFSLTPPVDFCSRCGSSLFYEATEAPDRIYIAAATLDPRTAPTPDSHVSYEQRLPWFHGVARLPCYREKTDVELPFA
jgi:hypothetical protein